MELLKPENKPQAQLNMQVIEQAINKANTSTNYPIMINIGKHVCNSVTQDYLEYLFTEAGYNVTRCLERIGYRYEALYLHHKPTIQLVHQIKDYKWNQRNNLNNYINSSMMK